MVLMKPRRWLGYAIALNDLIPEAEEILDRFECSAIPLDDTFGSSSDPAERPRSTILFVGPGVEQARLLELLDLLDGLTIHFLQTDTEGYNRKAIYIGTLNLDNDQAAPYTEALAEAIREPGLSPEDITNIILQASTIQVLTVRLE